MKRIVHYFAGLLLIIGCVALFSNGAYAAEIVASGTCGANGDNLTWTLDSDGVLTISGEGKMRSYDNSAPWYSYRTTIKSIIIGEDVTSIGSKAFSGCTGLTQINYNAKSVAKFTSSNYPFENAGTTGEGITVIFGGTVESIPSYLFYGVEKVTNITIPESVTSIGSYAFSGCTGLTSITIPKSITDLGVGAFSDCTELTELNYNARKVASYSSYKDCPFTNVGTSGEGITVIFGGTVESIPSYLFYGVEKVTNITIPESVTSIGNYAFSNCTGLTSITIPESVTRIGNNAFQNCTGLTSITIPESVTSISASAFMYCTGLTQINYNARNDTSTYSANYIYSIFYGAGTSGEGISVVIGETVESIPDYLFYGVENVTRITIPESVTSIGNKAFSDCKGLTQINYNARNVADFTSSTCPFTNAGTSGEGITVIFGGTVESIPSYLFYGVEKVTNITIPESVTSIGSYAFYGCTGLTSLTIPESVTRIGNNAFQNCTGLTSITIPESVTSIGGSAFYGCRGLTKINYNANITNFARDSNVFFNAGIGANGITVIFGEAVEAIPSYLFYAYNSFDFESNYRSYSPKVRSITIGSNVKSIGGYAFYNCKEVTSITIPEAVTNIGYGAFMYCTGLTEFNFNAKQLLTEDNFLNYTQSIVLNIGSGVEYIPASLYGGDRIRAIVVDSDNPLYSSYGDVLYNKTVKSLIKCPMQKAGIVDIPASVKTIKSEAFLDCSKIAGVRFLGDKPTFEEDSFWGLHLNAYYPYGNSSWDFRPSTIGGSYTVNWIAYSLGDPVSMQIKTLPSKTGYIRGESVDLAGLTYSVEFTDGCIETHTADELDSVSYDFSKLGTRQVTITYKGVSTTFNAKVGEIQEVVADIKDYPQSPHPYLSNMNEIYIYSYPGAEKLVVTFSDNTSTEFDVDYIYIYDKDGNQVGKYTGIQLAGQTLELTGDSFSILLESDDSSEEYGFSIESIVATVLLDHCVDHSWEVPVYIWSLDNCSVTASRGCTNCSDMETETVPTTSTTTATCIEDGITTYVATFENEAFAVQTKTVEIPALGHTLGETVRENEDPATCTEAGGYDEVVYCNVCHKELSREHVEIAALGHDWNAPNYTWSADNSTVTATRSCKRDASHIEAETAGTTYEVIKEATTSEPGTGRYTAVFKNTAFEAQTKDVEIPKLEKAATYVGISLSLKGDLSMNFYIDGEEGWTVDIDYDKEGSSLITVPLTASIYNNSQQAYRIVYTGIAAKEMTDRVVLTVRDENGDKVRIIRKSTGEYLKNDQVEYSVATWAINKLANPETEAKEIALAHALLNYGQMAQEYFDDYNLPGKPANPEGYLSDEMGRSAASFINSALDKVVPANAKDTVGYVGATLMLKGATSIRMYFSEAVSVRITDKKGDTIKYVTGQNKTGYYVEIVSIPSKDLDEMYTFTVTKDSKTCTIKYGALSWCNSRLANSSTETKEINLCKAMYLYNTAANGCF